MKKIIFLIIPILTILLLHPVYAEDYAATELYSDTIEKLDQLRIENINLSDTTVKLLSGDFAPTFREVIQALTNRLTDEFKKQTDYLIKILVVCILAGLLCHLQLNPSANGISELSFFSCYAMIATLSVNIISNISDTALDAINSVKLMIASLMPVMGSLIASAKQTAFVAFYPSLFVTMQGFIIICSQFFMPMIMTITALSVANTLSTRRPITKLIEFFQLCIKWGLGTLLTIYVGIIGVNGFSAYATGSITGRTVKYALCNFIPIVGNTLSESVEVILSSIRLLRCSIGIAGVIGLVTICTLPLLKILVFSLMFRFTSGITEPITDKRIVNLLNDLSGHSSLIFSILLMVAVMFIISIALLCVLFY